MLRIKKYLLANIETGLGLIFSLFVFGWAVSLVIFYIKSAFWNIGFPYNTFLPAPVTRFGDFYLLFDEWSRMGIGGLGYSYSYLPFTFIFVEILRIISGDPYFTIVLSQLPYFIFIPLIIFYLFRKKGFLFSIIVNIIILFSYPSLITWHTGNIESWVIILILFAIISLLSNKFNLCIFFISIAGAIKIYPLIFLLVILNFGLRKNIIVLLKSFIIVSVSNLFAITFLRGGLLDSGFNHALNVWNNFKLSQNMYQELMWFSGSGNAFGHSLLNSIHLIFGDTVIPTSHYYWLPGLVALILIVLIFNLHNRENIAHWRILYLAGVIGCLFVPTSTDYKLFYLLPGFLVLIYRESLNNLRNLIIATATICCFFPKPYFFASESPFSSATATFTTGLLLFILIFIFIDILNNLDLKTLIKFKK